MKRGLIIRNTSSKCVSHSRRAKPAAPPSTSATILLISTSPSPATKRDADPCVLVYEALRY